jgi:hypothetical protein
MSDAWQAEAEGRVYLGKSCRKVLVPSLGSTTDIAKCAVSKEYNGSGVGDFGRFATALRNAGLDGEGAVYVHSSLAIPAADAEGFSMYKQHAKATPDFHGKPWFSDVALRAENQIWYGRVMLFFRTSLTQHLAEGYAFIRYFEVNGRDPDLQLPKLVWQTSAGAYSVESISSILRVVHVVKDRSRANVHYLNDYLF